MGPGFDDGKAFGLYDGKRSESIVSMYLFDETKPMILMLDGTPGGTTRRCLLILRGGSINGRGHPAKSETGFAMTA